MTKSKIAKATTSFVIGICGAGVVVPLVTKVPDISALAFATIWIVLTIAWTRE